MAGAFSSAFSTAYDIYGIPLPPFPVDPFEGVASRGIGHPPAQPTWASRIYDLFHILVSEHRRFSTRFNAGMKLLAMETEPIVTHDEIRRQMNQLWTEDPQRFQRLWEKREQ